MYTQERETSHLSLHSPHGWSCWSWTWPSQEPGTSSHFPMCMTQDQANGPASAAFPSTLAGRLMRNRPVATGAGSWMRCPGHRHTITHCTISPGLINVSSGKKMEIRQEFNKLLFSSVKTVLHRWH